MRPPPRRRLHPNPLLRRLAGLRATLRLRDAREVRFPQGHPSGGRAELRAEGRRELRGVPGRRLRVQGGRRVRAQVRQQDHREGERRGADRPEGGQRQGPLRLVRHRQRRAERRRPQLLRRPALRLLPRLQLRGVPAVQLRLRLHRRRPVGRITNPFKICCLENRWCGKTFV